MKLKVVAAFMLASMGILPQVMAYNYADPYQPSQNRYKNSQEDDLAIFDDVRLHGGLSFLNSYQDLQTLPGVRERGSLSGFALNFGIDLFSVNWLAEGILMSYPDANFGSSRVSSNGFELRLLYDMAIFEGLTIHMGSGIASRGYNIRTAGQDRMFQSAAVGFVAGADYWPTGGFSLGLELNHYSPLASADDPYSTGLGVKFSGHF